MMNANELANLLEVDSWYKLVTREEIAAMLRQQQAEIENLNGRIERMIEKQSHHEAMAHAGGFEAGRELGMKQERERNNEPVAWMFQGAFDISTYVSVDKPNPDIYPNPIPLYTHPVKELTDAITLLEKYADKLEDERPNKGLSDVVLDCVEILRKAQENERTI